MVSLVGLVISGNYVWYLAIFVIFTRFGGEKNLGNASKASFGGNASNKGGPRGNFNVEAGFSLNDTAFIETIT